MSTSAAPSGAQVTEDVPAAVSGLRVTTGDGEVLVDDVSLRLRAGTVTALIGASGSGKTTTGLALLGEYPDGARAEGEVEVAASGRDGAGSGDGAGRGGRVGYVPQHPASALNPVRRTGALLHDVAAAQVRALGLPRRERRAAARERVSRALATAQLPDGEALLRRYPHQLSGGQQQRIVLAQALLLGARVIVADEPTTGQDALTKRQVVSELGLLARQGIAVLLLTHDLDVVRELADDVVVLRHGRAVESGPADKVLTAPEHEWTQELCAAQRRNELPRAQRAAVPGAGPAGPVGAALTGTAPPDTTPPDTTPPDRAPAEVAPAEVVRLHVREARYRDRERGTVRALRDAELTVRAGECLAVVGRSGSGKTTLGRCLAGLHRDWDGEAVLHGRDGTGPHATRTSPTTDAAPDTGGTRGSGVTLPHSVRHRSREQLAAVQYVFQDARSAFDEHRSVLAQTARTAVRLRGTGTAAAEAEARDALARVGLDEESAARRPGSLSGGELQRAALARALLARPRVLVCDEITSGLDMVTRAAVMDVLTGLLHGGGGDELSLVLITHDLPTASLARHIAVLDSGEIVEQGPAERLLADPRHPFTASLLAAAHRDGPAGTVPAP